MDDKRCINLFEVERSIFDLLVRTVQTTPALEGVVLRAVGGWVRDKLRNVFSDDIDIAVSYPQGDDRSITGETFVRNVVEVVGMGKDSPIVDAYYVPANREKSKNIAPATIVFGLANGCTLKIDFVNLRTDKYSDEDRIAETAPTNDPLLDAQRRDLTINAIYYNLATDEIEDYVNGIPDLEAKRLRCPTDPVTTYLDDPLRMLRALRFYSRWPDFTLDDSIVQAMAAPVVQAKYRKLADERAGPELRKLVQGAAPVRALRILLETGLYKPVFRVPDDYEPFSWDQRTPYHNLTFQDHTLKVVEVVSDLARCFALNEEERGLLVLSALFHDIGKLNPKYHQPRKDGRGLSYIGHEIGSADFAWEVMERLGFEKNEKRFVNTVVRWHMAVHEFEKDLAPKRLGRFVFKTKENWQNVILHGWADALGKDGFTRQEEVAIEDARSTHIKVVRDYINELGDLIHQPVIQGEDTMKLLPEALPELAEAKAFIDDKGEKKFWVKYALDKLLHAQWEKKVRTKEEAIIFLQNNRRQWFNLWRQQQKERANASSL